MHMMQARRSFSRLPATRPGTRCFAVPDPNRVPPGSDLKVVGYALTKTQPAHQLGDRLADPQGRQPQKPITQEPPRRERLPTRKME